MSVKVSAEATFDEPRATERFKELSPMELSFKELPDLTA
jgi:hypothetical protein